MPQSHASLEPVLTGVELAGPSFARASARALLNHFLSSVDAEPASRCSSREDGAAVLHADGVHLGCLVKGHQSQMKRQC